MHFDSLCSISPCANIARQINRARPREVERENKNRALSKPLACGFNKSHKPHSVASGGGTETGFNSLGFLVLSGFCSSSFTHLLSLNLLGGKGSFLVDVQGLGPERAVATFWRRWGCRLAAGLLLGHARRPSVAPK